MATVVLAKWNPAGSTLTSHVAKPPHNPKPLLEAQTASSHSLNHPSPPRHPAIP
ncbi:hypothetical protein K440DRAFT_630530 [Wilcoxina mikolae CBS 423.85]|nr:hypothetical protein K440DRAFT_630530 [Wilcoxina mikolae CBS 423.85]